MSTLAAADLPSDEEKDGDFILPSTRISQRRKPSSELGSKAKKLKSGDDGSGESSATSSSASSSQGDEASEDEREAKKVKLQLEADEAEGRRKKAAEAFAAFNNDTFGTTATGKNTRSEEKEMMVVVERERKFAGEVIMETVSLPASHSEAIAYLAKCKAGEGGQQSTGEVISTSESGGVTGKAGSEPQDTSNRDTVTGTENTSDTLPPVRSAVVPSQIPTAGPSVSVPKPTGKGPIRRKPRQSLEQLSAGLASGKKMTTLEKMDWKKHVASSSQVADELDGNRRSGGFLEKRDFLERVGDRRNRNETYEKKGSRR